MTGRRSDAAIAAVQANPNDPRHGTVNGYKNYKCRCQRCVAARQAEAVAQKTRRAANIDPDDPRHGTHTFYVAHMCRCPRCKAANATASRVWRNQGIDPGATDPRGGGFVPRQERDASPIRNAPDDPRHGTLVGYEEMGCRCRRCRALAADLDQTG